MYRSRDSPETRSEDERKLCLSPNKPLSSICSTVLDVLESRRLGKPIPSDSGEAVAVMELLSFRIRCGDVHLTGLARPGAVKLAGS